MKDKFSIDLQSRTYENVKKFWETEAREKKTKEGIFLPTSTIRDHFFRLHDLHTLLSFIPYNSKLLDVGCGTGFSTLIFNAKAKFTAGVDYSEEMIKSADRLLKDQSYRDSIFSEFGYLYKYPETEHVKFYVGDALKGFKLPVIKKDFDGKFNIIITERLLVNMPDYDGQIKCLKNLIKYASKDTLFLFMENAIQGHKITNKLRRKFGLPDLDKYWWNCYINEARLADWKKIGLKVESIITFDTYLMISKIIYPAAIGLKNIKFLSGANQAAMDIANLFRTKEAVDEVGLETVLDLYLNKLKQYDIKEYQAIKRWINKPSNSSFLKRYNWANFGHHRLYVCTRI